MLPVIVQHNGGGGVPEMGACAADQSNVNQTNVRCAYFLRFEVRNVYNSWFAPSRLIIEM